MKLVAISFVILTLSLACNEKDESKDSAAAMDHDHGSHDHSMGESMEVSDQVSSLSSNFQAKSSWQNETLSAGGATHNLAVNFFDGDGEMIHGVTITEVTPWMQVHGHGAPTDNLMFQQHDEMGHAWMIMGVEFSMPGAAGAWVIKVKFTANGQEDEVHLPVTKEVGAS